LPRRNKRRGSREKWKLVINFKFAPREIYLRKIYLSFLIKHFNQAFY